MFGSPDIDQFTKLKVNIEGDIKKDYIAYITGTISSDDFPNHEAITYDSKGNALWMGTFETKGDRGYGPLRDLVGAGENNVKIKVNMSVKVSKYGVCQGVIHNGKIVSIEQWNNKFNTNEAN